MINEGKPKLKVIRGNKERGKEVIKLLENLGGHNILGCVGKCNTSFYYINPDGCIVFSMCEDSFFSNYELEVIELSKEPKNEQQMIDKAVKWLALNAQLYGGFNPGRLEDMVTKFTQAMLAE